jgi:hypothetical protein
MAERQGFEPWVPLPGQLISSELRSATLAPLQENLLCKFSRSVYRVSAIHRLKLKLYKTLYFFQIV